MKSISLVVSLFIMPSFLHSQYVFGWNKHMEKGYTLYCSTSDEPAISSYANMIDHGEESVVNFFGGNVLHTFDVYIYPNLAMMDSVWRKDWALPNFKSECWMVASGIGRKIDILSPGQWSTQSCEHNYADQPATQKLITHELFHVYHAQINASHEFQ